MKDKILEQGMLLISDPFMMDPYFKKTVLALCDYSKQDGAVGFILNRPTNLKMEDVLFDFPQIDCQVFYGGPVANETIHYIHRKGDLIENSREIMPGLFWGGDFGKLKFLIKNEVILPQDIRFYIGYSGWSAGQLEEEVETNSWITDTLDLNYPFKNNSQEMWYNCLHNKGNHFSVLADMSDYVSLN